MRQEVIREQRDVLETLPERRQLDRNDAQAIEQILAERSLGHALRGITVRRRDEPNVDHRVLLLAADATHDAVLEHAEQLRLDRQRHLRELVEKQRSAVRDLEQTGLVAIGTGERAFAMSEQLALEQPFGQCRAVDRDDLSARATAVLVNELRDELPYRCRSRP